MNSWIKDQNRHLFLLPGEQILKTSILFNCSIALTTYRLYFICKNSKFGKNDDRYCHFGIPLNLILKIEQLEFKYLRIWTKLGAFYILSFENTDMCNDWLKNITDCFLSKMVDSIFAFKYYDILKSEFPISYLIEDHNADLQNIDHSIMKKEFKRLCFQNDQWKITDVNSDFEVCQSYPRYHIVPTSITNKQINLMADFRGNRRFPSVVWRSLRNGAVMIRCAQPQVGLMCWRNPSDEAFFKEVADCLKKQRNTKKLVIVDARHYSTAQFNRIRGGGVEFSEYYGEAEIIFMQLENIHSVRASFDYISLFAINSESWLTSFENSYWLKYVSKLLKSAADIAKSIYEDGRSVIIHCSDGWDRTPQLTSLSQIILDSYYRTIEGFQILIEKEWILFGHKFSDRCSLGRTFDNKERSPVFVQWLDCIHQLIKQFPNFFEFNETFLIKLAIHAHSGLFGNFLCNTEEERLKNNIRKSTVSIWKFLSTNDSVSNPLYYKNSVPEYEYENYKSVLYPRHSTKYLYPWNRLFFEALNSSENHNMFSLDYCASKNQSLTSFQNNSIEDFREEFNNMSDNNSINVLKKKDFNLFLNVKKSKSESDLSKLEINKTNSHKFYKAKSIAVSNDAGLIKESLSMHFKELTVNNNLSVINTLPNSTFINQYYSTSKLNESMTCKNANKPIINPIVDPLKRLINSKTESIKNFRNSSLNINYPVDQRKATSYQEIELIPYANNDNSLTNGNYSSNRGAFINKTATHAETLKINKKYFQIHDFDDGNEISTADDFSLCDKDGIYKFIEPVNILANHWKHKFNDLNNIINTQRSKMGIEHDVPVKYRTDSNSSAERPRNEDSISSHDSYVMIDQSYNGSRNMNGIKCSYDINKAQRPPNTIIDGQVMEPISCNKEFIKSRQVYCDQTSNSGEKSQA